MNRMRAFDDPSDMNRMRAFDDPSDIADHNDPSRNYRQTTLTQMSNAGEETGTVRRRTVNATAR